MNNNVFRLLLTASLFFLVESVYPQKWISLDRTGSNKAVSIQKIQSDQTTHIVNYTIHGLYDNEITNSKGIFQQLSLENNSCLMKVGSPALPILTQLIAIPEGASFSVSIKEEKWTDVNIGQIYPAQRPLLEDESSDEFVKDEKAYKNAFLPQMVQISKEMEWRGVRNVRLTICPFKYYPNQNRLSVLSEFCLQVTFKHGEQPRRAKAVYEQSDIFHLFDNDIFGNGFKKSSSQLPSGNTLYPQGKMLIIVGRNKNIEWLANCDKMIEFRKWKAFKGIETFVEKLTAQNSTYEKIKSLINDYYTIHNIRYVLLVGDMDADHIPLGEVVTPYRTVYSDYWYGCMDKEDDYEADIAVGRFSVRDIYDFSNMVNKTIEYEKTYNSSNKVLLISHLQDAGVDTLSYQSCSNIIKDACYKEPVSFVTAYGASDIIGGNNATNADVICKINDGIHIVNYRGHASSNFWGHNDKETNVYKGWNRDGENFTEDQINNIDPNARAIYFSIACYTGNIGDSCMLETFTRAKNGAVAFLGATRNSFRKPNHYYNQYLFEKLYNEGIYHIGDVNVAAHINNIQNLDSTDLAKDDAMCYLLGGDPTLEIWTSVPQQINDNLDLQLTNGQMYFTTDIESPFYVSLTQEDGSLIGIEYPSGSGGVFDKQDDNFFFTINRHNSYPRVIFCNMSNELEKTVEEYDTYSFVTPLTLNGVFESNDNDPTLKVKNGKKLIIRNGAGGVTIQKDFECERGSILEIK